MYPSIVSLSYIVALGNMKHYLTQSRICNLCNLLQVLLTPQPTIIFSSTNETYLNTTKYSVGAGYLLTIYNPSLTDGAQYKCQDEETDRYNLLYLIVIGMCTVNERQYQ